jgi:hypothetical protein
MVSKTNMAQIRSFSMLTGLVFAVFAFMGCGSSGKSSSAQQKQTEIINAQVPVISAQPISAVYTQGDTANALAVTASVSDNGTLTYQWYKTSSNETTDGVLIDGATSNSYMPSTDTAETTYYYVVVTNTNNNATGEKTAAAISQTTEIIVNALPLNNYVVKCYDADLNKIATVDAIEGEIALENICGVGDWYLAGANAPSVNYNLDGDVSFYGAANVIEITDQSELEAVRNNLSGKYILMNDIALELSGSGWTPIGTDSARFTGVFNGGGHKITSLWISRSSTNYVGLFGYIGAGGRVKNLGVDINGAVIGAKYVGGIAGYLLSGEIINSYVAGGTVRDNDASSGGYIGAIAGQIQNSNITNSYAVNSLVKGRLYAGGIAGYTNGSSFITKCYSAVDTVETTSGYNGGISGYINSASAVTNSTAINHALIEVATTSRYINRVAGYAGTGAASNNYALDSMTITTSTSGPRAESNAGMSKTNTELQTQLTYEELGWSFGNDDSHPWVMPENGGYPILYWQK